MKLSIPHLLILPLTITVGACASAAGTQPHDMSAADHQAAAAQNENQDQKEASDLLDALQQQEKALKRKKLLEKYKAKQVEKDW